MILDELLMEAEERDLDEAIVVHHLDGSDPLLVMYGDGVTLEDVFAVLHHQVPRDGVAALVACYRGKAEIVPKDADGVEHPELTRRAPCRLFSAMDCFGNATAVVLVEGEERRVMDGGVGSVVDMMRRFLQP